MNPIPVAAPRHVERGAIVSGGVWAVVDRLATDDGRVDWGEACVILPWIDGGSCRLAGPRGVAGVFGRGAVDQGPRGSG